MRITRRRVRSWLLVGATGCAFVATTGAILYGAWPGSRENGVDLGHVRLFAYHCPRTMGTAVHLYYERTFRRRVTADDPAGGRPEIDAWEGALPAEATHGCAGAVCYVRRGVGAGGRDGGGGETIEDLQQDFEYGVALSLPWAAGLPAAAMAVGGCGLAALRRRDRHRAAGRCRRCGYDLRATAGQCPECGAVRLPQSPI